MKRLLIACYLSSVYAVFGLFFPVAGNAGISVDINIPLPGIVITEPPAMAVVPGAYVYFAPDIEADLFFYRGYWYRPYEGRWYISLEYNGHWGGIAIGNVPPALINLPPDYRSTHPGHERMPWGMVQRNWRTWEEERYWDNYEGRDEHAMPRHGHGMGHGMGMGM
jgi:hypothetical protein